MSEPLSSPAQARSPDDALPPVQPPSMGFVVQLFVVPAVIVTVIVSVYLLFTWLAGLGQDPMTYVHNIRRNNASSWQAAHDLALELTRQEALRRDERLARELIDLLKQRLVLPLPSREDRTAWDSAVYLRRYLCSALGQFELAAPAEVLVEAARTGGHGRPIEVRLAGIEAVARLWSNLPQAQAQLEPAVLPMLLAAAADSEPQIRVWASYALGVVGGPRARQALRRLLSPDQPRAARYNAATGLARQGDAAGLPQLAEMLDPAAYRPEKDEPDDQRRQQQATLLINGLKACEVLARQRPPAELAPLADAVRQLRSADLEDMVPDTRTADFIHQEAERILAVLSAGPAEPSADQPANPAG